MVEKQPLPEFSLVSLTQGHLVPGRGSRADKGAARQINYGAVTFHPSGRQALNASVPVITKRFFMTGNKPHAQAC